MDEVKIWNLLMKGISNPYGVAAIMGNLMAESSLNPLCMTGKNKKKYDSPEQYVQLINENAICEEDFANDGIAFGLVQWAYKARKANLYRYSRGKGIQYIDTQIGFILQELPTYKTAWNAVINATEIDIPTKEVMLRYEKPANTGESAIKKRQNYALGYFKKYAANEPVKVASKMVETTADKVFVRSGPGTEYYRKERIEKKGTRYLWIATAENGWHAIKFGSDAVYWISGEYSQIV